MSSLGDQVRDWHQGVLAVASKDWDRALCLFSDVQEPRAKMYFNMGCVRLMAGDPEAALRAFDQAVTKDPCMAVGFFQRGVANFQLERFQEAVSDFQLALAQLRGNAAIDYTQLGLYFKLHAWEPCGMRCPVQPKTFGALKSPSSLIAQGGRSGHSGSRLLMHLGASQNGLMWGKGGTELKIHKVLYNTASAQCQAGLWTKAADTLEEAISKWPEGAQDILDTALDQVRKQVPLQLRQVPKGEVFQPPRQYLQHLEPMDFLSKAKVVASVIPDNRSSDGWPQKGSQMEQVGHQSSASMGGHMSLLASGGPDPGPPGDSSEAGGAAAEDSESLVTVTVQCHLTVPLKAPRGTDLSSLRTLLAQALLHQAQSGQLSYQAPREKFWTPISTEDSLRSAWKNVAVGSRGLHLQCRGAWGRPVLYRVVARHSYTARRPEDLDFRQGDTVDVLCEVDEAWLEGHRDGCIGIFPKCFVVPAGACVEARAVPGPKPGERH